MCQTTKIELLSPARDLFVGKTAIDAGADAVYIGAPLFSARQAAGNKIEDIASLCEYAHQFEAKVLVALNTLLTADELKQATEMIWQLYHVGADAIIVQDVNLLKMPLPPIRLHASTQCDNRTVNDVIERQKTGFKRVVLARELSIEQIKEIKAATDIELEAFVHGALCVSYSGKCYLSEAIMGRSANRGACAQMCRQQYDLLDRDMKELLHGKYILSLRDLDRSQYLSQMLDAGITTLKIEGRLKDADYVKNITGYYRLLLDKIFAASNGKYEKSSKGNVYLGFQPDPKKTFHRSQTAYFINGRTQQMANINSPKSTGEHIGKLMGVDAPSNVITINLQSAIQLHNGDGLTIEDKGFYVNRVSGNKILVNQLPDGLKTGVDIFRNYDKYFSDNLKQAKTRRTIPIDISLHEAPNGFLLRLGDMEKLFLYAKEPANNKNKAEETIKTQLSKLGGTIYEARTIDINWSQPYFIPTSVINSWRRELITEKTKKDAKINTIISQSKKIEDQLLTPSYPMPLPKELMTCKYCILYELGQCRKKNLKSTTKEPQFLKCGKHLLELHFDCRKCEMTITQQ